MVWLATTASRVCCQSEVGEQDTYWHTAFAEHLFPNRQCVVCGTVPSNFKVVMRGTPAIRIVQLSAQPGEYFCGSHETRECCSRKVW